MALYDLLRDRWPSPVTELNRAVAVGLRDGPAAGLAELAPLLDEPALAAYGYLSAARADFLRLLERWTEATTAYEEAVALTRQRRGARLSGGAAVGGPSAAGLTVDRSHGPGRSV